MKKSIAADSKPEIENLTPKKFSVTMKSEYLLFLPKDYDARGKKKWPVIVFFSRSRRACGTNIWGAAVWPDKIHQATFCRIFPFIMIMPLCPDRHKWSAGQSGAGGCRRGDAKSSQWTHRGGFFDGPEHGAAAGRWSLATIYPSSVFAASPPVAAAERRCALLSAMEKALAR